MISLSGPDRIVAVMRLDEKAPTKTALFSRRELRRALDLLDALDPEDQRIELALLDASAPVLVARPYDPTGEGWVAVAGHSGVPESAASAECSEPEPAAPAPKGPVKVPVQVDPAPAAKPKAPEPKSAPKRPIYIPPVKVDPAPEAKPEPKPQAAPAAKPAPQKEAEKPAPAEICEQCGGPVSKTQKQMSQLFLNKTLCKGCLDKLTEGQA